MRKLTSAEIESRISSHQAEGLHPVYLILDNLRSQHNIGSIFRTADAFGVSRLYLCGITATPPSREIHKTALGATETVAWSYAANTIELIRSLKAEGVRIIAVEQTDAGIPLDRHNPVPGSLALVFGNEVNGISNEVLGYCDAAIEIPQFGSKHSLNVSVCAGIVLYELLQKLRKLT